MNIDSETSAPPPSGNLFMALIGGLFGAVIGAALWIAITAITGIQFGLFAILTGAIVGLGVRRFGHGYSRPFRMIGGIFALLAVMVGIIGGLLFAVAKEADVPISQALDQFSTNAFVRSAVLENLTQPINFLFYLIALVDGYILSAVRRPKA